MPDSSEADAREAAALIQQTRVAEARIAIGRAISERDDVPEYYLLQGQIELVAGAKDNAFVAFKNALDLDSTNRLALQQVARLGLEVGQVRDAIRAVETMLVLEPRNRDALVMQGLIHLVQNDHEEALQYAERLRSFDPNNEGGIILEARARLMLGNPKEALALISDFEEFGGVTIATARNRIEIGRYLSDADQMEQGFRFILGEVPDDLSARVDYANFLFKRDKSPEAVTQLVAALTKKDIAQEDVAAALAVAEEYDAAAALAPALSQAMANLSPAARVKLARFYIDADLLDRAEVALKSLDTPDAKATSAWLTFRSGDAMRAELATQEVLEDDADNCIAFFVSANVDLNEGRYRDAIRKGQRSAAQCPQEKEAWFVTGRAFAANEDMANARRVFRDGLDALPQNTAMTSAYVGWLKDNNAGREAIAVARKLTQKSPALLSGWRLYNDVCEQMGSPCAKRAQEGLVEAQAIYGVDLIPGARPATDLLGRLRRQ